MRIGSFNEGNFQDHDGGLCSVIFTLGCNYNCPACHAKSLLEGGNSYNEEEILNRIRRKKDYIKWVVLCGGEPTIQPDIIPFARKLKEKGLAIKLKKGRLVKLDSNGSNPGVLQELKEEKLVDCVAMDVKGPPELYPRLVGREFLDLRDDYGKGIAITSQFPDYEFRTTVCPVLRDDGKFSFMTVEEIVETAELIYDCTGSNQHKYFLQPFVARGKEEMVDERLSKDNLPKNMHETPKELLEAMRDAVKEILPNCDIR